MPDETVEPLVTQCPTCKTRFRVTEVQLGMAGGRVRCGACLAVFAGLEHLVLGAGPRLKPRQIADAALDELLDELRHDVPKPAKQAANDALEGRADDRVEGAPSVSPAAQGADDDVDHAKDSDALDRASFDDGYAVAEAPDEAAIEPAPAAPPPALATARRGPSTHSTRAAVRAELDLGLDLEALIAARPRRQRRGWVVMLLFICAAALAAQVLYLQFDSWSKRPDIRPVYGWLCDRLDCELPQMRALDALVSKNLVVRADPEVPGALLVDALIVNEATFAQPFPVIELRFSSMGGNLIAGRRFRPDEYLAGELQGATLMAPRTPVHIALAIDDPGQDAVNYVMVFR